MERFSEKISKLLNFFVTLQGITEKIGDRGTETHTNPTAGTETAATAFAATDVAGEVVGNAFGGV